MARYRIDEDAAAVSIELTELAGRQEELLEAFRECQEGRCTCPTEEYRKVASMDVRADEDRIAIRLSNTSPASASIRPKSVPASITRWARSTTLANPPRAKAQQSSPRAPGSRFARFASVRVRSSRRPQGTTCSSGRVHAGDTPAFAKGERHSLIRGPLARSTKIQQAPALPLS